MHHRRGRPLDRGNAIPSSIHAVNDRIIENFPASPEAVESCLENARFSWDRGANPFHRNYRVILLSYPRILFYFRKAASLPEGKSATVRAQMLLDGYAMYHELKWSGLTKLVEAGLLSREEGYRLMSEFLDGLVTIFLRFGDHSSPEKTMLERVLE